MREFQEDSDHLLNFFIQQVLIFKKCAVDAVCIFGYICPKACVWSSELCSRQFVLSFNLIDARSLLFVYSMNFWVAGPWFPGYLPVYTCHLTRKMLRLQMPTGFYTGPGNWTWLVRLVLAMSIFTNQGMYPAPQGILGQISVYLSCSFPCAFSLLYTGLLVVKMSVEEDCSENVTQLTREKTCRVSRSKHVSIRSTCNLS